MCGILCVLQYGGCSQCNFEAKFAESLHRRGPDGQYTKNINFLPDKTHQTLEGCSLRFSGYTLQLQGPLTLQPMVDCQGNVLMWNGEIFSGDIKVEDQENDGQVLLDKLSSCSSDAEIVSELAKIKGPWSFIYLMEATQSLFFGRDFFGRRSLLWYFKGGDSVTFAVSSVAQRPSLAEEIWEEVPANGIYKLNLGSEQISHDHISLSRLPWQQIGSISEMQGNLTISSGVPASKINVGPITSQGQLIIQDVDDVCVPAPVIPLNRQIIDRNEAGCRDDEMSKAAARLVKVLEEAVRRRVHNVPFRKPMKCTEGSNVGRIICDQQLVESNTESVIIEGMEIKSVITAGMEMKCDQHQQKFASVQEVSPGMFASVSDEKMLGRNCHAAVAILFSGGIDSMVLAALSDRSIPLDQPIDLLNVAFEQKRKGNREKPFKERDRFAVPDRVTGRSGLKELQDLSPQRIWNLIEINVTVKELQEARQAYISDLVYPSCSVLDDSIGSALWFAARGKGVLYRPEDSSKECQYTSLPKVVLNGLGADEQLAGYSRHRTHFTKGGWEGLLDQIELDIARISSRNLGRDDRIISDHAREARFPFLDEDVVSYLNSLPIDLKADLTLPRGEGEKRLLRIAGRLIGLTASTRLPKRAIQFGSRIAKLEDSGEKASDICDRLMLTKCSDIP